MSVAPTSSGGTAIIEILNILEGFDVAALGFGTAEGAHLLAEAMKIAFADRFEYMGDPAFVEVPVGALTDKGYAAQRRGEIDLVPGARVQLRESFAVRGRGRGYDSPDGGGLGGERGIHDSDDSRGVRIEGDYDSGYGYAAEQHDEHIRPASGQRELYRAGQADGEQYVADHRDEGR